MAYSGYDYRDFYETEQGKEIYEKYLKDISGIDTDHLTDSTSQKLKNEFYNYVNKTYEIQDSIVENVSSGFSNIKNLAIIAILLYIIFKYGKES